MGRHGGRRGGIYRWCLPFVPVILAAAAAVHAANPIVPGWYADPEIRLSAGQYWIYPTSSDGLDPSHPPLAFTPEQQRLRARAPLRPSYSRQVAFDAFSSPDLVHWTRHPDVLTTRDIGWAAYALWAPSVLQIGNHYYFAFGANDIQHEGELGGIGIAVADAPGGPFHDALGVPLVGGFHHGAQPIDPFLFRDDDGQVYLFYGGWGHCNVARLSPDLAHVEPMPDGTLFKEITPPGYTEGSFMIRRRGLYYLMWSEGGWTGPDYSVSYATGPSPTGPFTPRGKILQQDARVATGAGHHSVLRLPGMDEWVIAYHRHPLGDKVGEHRVLAIERLEFAPDGSIRPVRITTTGVPPFPATPRR